LRAAQAFDQSQYELSQGFEDLQTNLANRLASIGLREGNADLTIFQIPRGNERLTIDSMPMPSFNSALKQPAACQPRCR
jgi:hypothetical protein